MNQLTKAVLPIQIGNRWVLITVDEYRGQCLVPDVDGGRYYVNGVGPRSQEAAAAYSVRHGRSFESKAAALVALCGHNLRMEGDGGE